VGNKASEATTLSNMAVIYRLTRQYQEASTLYEQALPIIREVGNRAGEVAALNGLAYLYRDMQRYPEALATFEQFITLAQQIALPAAEAAGLVDTALLLHQHLNRTADAITAMENAIALLTKAGLSQDAARRTIEDLQTRLRAMSLTLQHPSMPYGI